MKLTKALTYGAAALAAMAALCACDDIKEGDRFIPLPAVEAQRVVLLEEFTGQKCVNCPQAHRTVEQLMEQYPGAVVAVGIHGGPQATAERRGGLANSEGEAYFEANGSPSLPIGKINRTSGLQNRDQWSNIVREELAKPSKIGLEVAMSISEDGKTLEINTKATPYDDYEGMLQLWVVESSIVAKQDILQEGTSATINDYVHSHVFRGTVNGLDGENITLKKDSEKILSHSINIKEIWNAANLSVVAFVYNKDGVAQAAITK